MQEDDGRQEDQSEHDENYEEDEESQSDEDSPNLAQALGNEIARMDRRIKGEPTPDRTTESPSPKKTETKNQQEEAK